MAFGWLDLEGQAWWRRLLRRSIGWPHLVRRLQSLAVLKFLDLRTGQHVADVGAGGGYYAVEIARHVRLAVAIEIQLAPFGSLRRVPQFGVGLSAAVADARRLPFRDHVLDRVLLSGTLQALDAERAVAECARVLKPRGMVVVTVLAGHPLIRRAYSSRGMRRVLLRVFGLPRTYQQFQTEYARRHFVTRYYAPDDVVALMDGHELRLVEHQFIPSGLADAVIEMLHVLFWRVGVFRPGRFAFALWFPFLQLLQGGSAANRQGSEWVGSFEYVGDS